MNRYIILTLILIPFSSIGQKNLSIDLNISSGILIESYQETRIANTQNSISASIKYEIFKNPSRAIEIGGSFISVSNWFKQNQIQPDRDISTRLKILEIPITYRKFINKSKHDLTVTAGLSYGIILNPSETFKTTRTRQYRFFSHFGLGKRLKLAKQEFLPELQLRYSPGTISQTGQRYVFIHYGLNIKYYIK